MGDMKHMKLKIRGASRTDVHNALHHEFKEFVDYPSYKEIPDSSSLRVEVGGPVDVGKLYERLKKIACSVKIEAVVPYDLKAEIDKYQKDLQRIRGERDELKSTLNRTRGELQSVKRDKENLQSKLDEKRQDLQKLNKDKEDLNSKVDEKRQDLQKLKKDKEDLNLKLDKKRQDLQSLNKDKEDLKSKLERKREENTSLAAQNKKLQQKIRDLQNMGGQIAELHVMGQHELHQVQVYRKRIVKVETKFKLSKNDGEAKRVIEQLKQPRGHQ